MFSKSIFVLAFAAVAQFASAASPPGCMLGAINTYETPADIESVCKEKDAGSKIVKYCGDASQQAMVAFADVCKAKGVSVSTDLPSSTASSKATGTASSQATGSADATTLTTATGTAAGGSPQNTGGAGDSPSASRTTGAPAQSTGAAGRLEVAGLAVVAGLFMAAL